MSILVWAAIDGQECPSHFTYRRKDQVHLLDMISVGLIDESWLDRLSPELQSRLQELLDDPEG